MSGPICPHCGNIAFEEIKLRRRKCIICGWKGNGLPRKSLTMDRQRRISMETQRLLQLRAQGRLTFVKIEIKGDGDQEWDITNEIMELFDIDEISGSDLLIFHDLSCTYIQNNPV